MKRKDEDEESIAEFENSEAEIFTSIGPKRKSTIRLGGIERQGTMLNR